MVFTEFQPKSFTPVYGKRGEVQSQIGTQLINGVMTPWYITKKPDDNAIVGFTVVDHNDKVYYIKTGENNYDTGVTVTRYYYCDCDQQVYTDANIGVICTAIDDSTKYYDIDEMYITVDTNGNVTQIGVPSVAECSCDEDDDEEEEPKFVLPDNFDDLTVDQKLVLLYP